jgi:hypothetical protein
LNRVENPIKKHKSNYRDNRENHRHLQLIIVNLVGDSRCLHGHQGVKQEHIGKHEDADSTQPHIQVFSRLLLSYQREHLIEVVGVPHEVELGLQFGSE